MNTSKFWPLDFDSDGEIYENVAWDLPGFRQRRSSGTRSIPAPQAKPRVVKPAAR